MIDDMIGGALRVFALLSAASVTACGDRPASELEALQAGGDDDDTLVESQAAEPVPAGATLEQIVDLKARKYASGLVADGTPITGSIAEAGRSDHLVVLRAGHCYRVLAAGDAEVHDMDLFLYDPEGVQTQQDPAEDRYPVLGLQAEICPAQGGAYRLQVHMYKGGGRFVARVYRTP